MDKLNLHDRLLDYGGNYVHTVIPNVMSLLQRALNKRIDLVQIKQYPLAQVCIEVLYICCAQKKKKNLISKGKSLCMLLLNGE